MFDPVGTEAKSGPVDALIEGIAASLKEAAGSQPIMRSVGSLRSRSDTDSSSSEPPPDEGGQDNGHLMMQNLFPNGSCITAHSSIG